MNKVDFSICLCYYIKVFSKKYSICEISGERVGILRRFKGNGMRFCITALKKKGMYAMNNKKPLIMRIAVLAIAAVMVLGLVIGTVVGVY